MLKDSPPKASRTATTKAAQVAPRKAADSKAAKANPETKPGPTLPAPSALARKLPVREGESAWTTAEVKDLIDELEQDIARQTEQIEIVNEELTQLHREGAEGAGRDTADIGSNNFERLQEMSIAANGQESLNQSLEAISRLAQGSYGVCDRCGEAIGKHRLQAFPRASLCVRCKQLEERR